MRFIATLALTLVVGATSFGSDADDIRAFVRAQSAPVPIASQDTKDDIKDYARYQRERLRTYVEAVQEHTKNKTTVIVWVGFTDNETLYKNWQETKDLGYHVFVRDFPDVYTGVVVGKDHQGAFGRLPTITDNFVIKIKADCAMQFSGPTQSKNQPTCANGKCYFPSSGQSFSAGTTCSGGSCGTTYGSCANGQCGLPSQSFGSSCPNGQCGSSGSRFRR